MLTLLAGLGARSSRGVEGPEGPELSSSSVSSRDTGSVVSESIKCKRIIWVFYRHT